MDAAAHYRHLLGLGREEFLAAAAPAVLVRGIVYQPYYVGVMIACAGVTWLGPQTWDFTRALPPWKVVFTAIALWASMLVLATQAYNPFIYFIF